MILKIEVMEMKGIRLIDKEIEAVQITVDKKDVETLRSAVVEFRKLQCKNGIISISDEEHLPKEAQHRYNGPFSEYVFIPKYNDVNTLFDNRDGTYGFIYHHTPIDKDKLLTGNPVVVLDNDYIFRSIQYNKATKTFTELKVNKLLGGEFGTHSVDFEVSIDFDL